MGVIQCGAFTGNTTVTLGWEPQFVMIKRIDAAGDWSMIDSSRGCAVGGVDAVLNANLSSAESSTNYIDFKATGFIAKGLTGNYIYIVVRRSNKPPTLGTQVYNAIARTGTGAAATVTGVGFAPDSVFSRARQSITTGLTNVVDRLRGVIPRLFTNITDAEETSITNAVTAFGMDGITLGADSNGAFNAAGRTYINHFFKRAPGVFSILCDTGTALNKLESHNLGSIPELMIRKGRSGATQWEVYFSSLGNTKKLVLNSTSAEATDTTAWNSTSPTATQVSIGTGSNVNTNAATYVTYLMSSLTGISKVGTYTGNGTTQTVDMGFTTGCRFFLVKASSTTGSWWIFDSVRGIVASTDFGLQLNSIAAEVTSADAVDPSTVGIVVVQEAICSLNANGVVYQYWAIA